MNIVSKSLAHVVRAFAWAIFASLPVQVYFAGAFVFGALSVEWHRRFGVLIALATLLTALLSLTTRTTRENAKKHWALVGIVLVQMLIVWLRPKFPAVSALHVPNTGLLLFLARRAAVHAKVPAAAPAPRLSKPALEVVTA
jgi:hypothetical protein